MKRVFSLFLAVGSALSSIAQEPAPNANPYSNGHEDNLSPGWVFDLNLKAGVLMQDLTTVNSLANYYNNIQSVSNSGGSVKFSNGMAYGFDAQIGYFFGGSRHFGVGAGFMYQYQQGDLTMSNPFTVQYQATDYLGKTFRQVITSNQNVKESLQITNMNIPIVLKYKKRFSRVFGFTADAGAVINVQEHNAYKTNATFDYEAIYQPNADGVATYDASATPSANDLLYTKAGFTHANPGITDAELQSKFNTLRNEGYNVGLGIAPNSNSGSVSYLTGSVGFIVQPALSIYLSDMVALNVGAYYMYQPFKNTTKDGYSLTNNAGDYSSVMNTVSVSNNQSYGANLGIRFFFGRQKDTDGDGIPDKRDKCPYVPGLAQFFGCPDTDGDGIPDNEDSCVKVPGIAKFHGCPDSDGDGIPDKDDACPYVPGPAKFHGCPDRDGDGIIDKDDACPDQPGLAQYHGCPDTDGDGVPDNEDKCPTVAGPADNHGCPYPEAPKTQPADEVPRISTPILFEVNSVNIHRDSYSILEEAVKKLNEDKDAVVVVDGYTDITGSKAYNAALSRKRANAVKAYLKKLGINPKRVKVVGHGSNDPAADNSTMEGRLKNRRAVMRLNVGE